MESQYRVRVYQSASEFEAALSQEARANWHLKHLCSHGPTGVLAVYSCHGPASGELPEEVAPEDHAAQVAQEANLTHEFSDPRAED